MPRITEDRSNRVDRLAEHLGARPYMARLVRAKRLGYFETPSVNAALQRRGTSALLTVRIGLRAEPWERGFKGTNEVTKKSVQ